MLFLIDGSWHIGEKQFLDAQRYLKRLVSKMTIGRDQTHVGLIQYSGTDYTKEEAVLGKHLLRNSITSAIGRMKYNNDRRKSNLAYALKVASDKVKCPLVKYKRRILFDEDTRILRDTRILFDEDTRILFDEDTRILSDEDTRIPCDEDTRILCDEDTRILCDEDTRILFDTRKTLGFGNSV